MTFCSRCKRIMQCVKTGARVVYHGGTHVYPGDEYECRTCGAKVVEMGKNAYHSSQPNLPSEENSVYKAKETVGS